MDISPAEPVWLTPGHAIKVNLKEVGETGEPHFVRDIGALESAIARAQNRWSYHNEEDAVRLAVCLAYGIAQNHPFEQGNKRTGFVMALLFLAANGYRYIGPDTTELGKAFDTLVTHKMSEDDFAETLRPYIVPITLIRDR